LVIPETASTQKDPIYIVTSKGDEVPDTIKIGDRIAAHPNGGMDYFFNSKIYKILKYSEIYGVITNG